MTERTIGIKEIIKNIIFTENIPDKIPANIGPIIFPKFLNEPTTPKVTPICVFGEYLAVKPSAEGVKTACPIPTRAAAIQIVKCNPKNAISKRPVANNIRPKAMAPVWPTIFITLPVTGRKIALDAS